MGRNNVVVLLIVYSEDMCETGLQKQILGAKYHFEVKGSNVSMWTVVAVTGKQKVLN